MMTIKTKWSVAEAKARFSELIDQAGRAQVHDLALVTRNADDFATSVKTVLNPWT